MTELKVLPPHEMIEVQALPLDEKRKLFISGYINYDYQLVVLYRGDGTSIQLNWSFFQDTNAITEPDFHDFEIIDYGHAVKFGKYEASTHSILIARDPEYKKYCESIRNQN